jgi:FixJ family two-component response regulator
MPFSPQAWPKMEIPLVSIVDDDEAVLRALESLVKSLGFAAHTFPSAELFLQSSKVSVTRCLVLDVQMPKMSGLELQERLLHLGFDIPIIFITAFPDEGTRTRALDAGAICFLLKPFDLINQRFDNCLRAAFRRPRGLADPFELGDL